LGNATGLWWERRAEIRQVRHKKSPSESLTDFSPSRVISHQNRMRIAQSPRGGSTPTSHHALKCDPSAESYQAVTKQASKAKLR
jgi:hypothetical protein